MRTLIQYTIMDHDINKVIEFCTLQKFRNELEDLKVREPESDKIAKLEKIIENYLEKSKPKQKTKAVSDIFGELDQYLYKKPWIKLTDFHKAIKIKEYVGKLIFDTPEKQQELLDSVMAALEEKKLSKKDTVNYDSFNGEIVAINKVIFVKEHKSYEYVG
jgi:hypothetical protein